MTVFFSILRDGSGFRYRVNVSRGSFNRDQSGWCPTGPAARSEVTKVLQDAAVASQNASGSTQ